MNKKVALFANGWNGENLDFFIKGFNEYFANNDVDLFLFTSHMLSGHSLAVHNAEESIYNRLWEMLFWRRYICYLLSVQAPDIIMSDMMELDVEYQMKEKSVDI